MAYGNPCEFDRMQHKPQTMRVKRVNMMTSLVNMAPAGYILTVPKQ